MINTRGITEEYRLSRWAQIIQGRVESKLTIKAYCDREGICGNTYFYWQRKLREMGTRQMEGEASKTPQALVPSGWAQVSRVAVAQSTKDFTLSIEIGSYRIEVSDSTAPELLEKVCRVLGSLC
jgi:putative transposase